jgi:hypothetical protein
MLGARLRLSGMAVFALKQRIRKNLGRLAFLTCARLPKNAAARKIRPRAGILE